MTTPTMIALNVILYLFYCFICLGVAFSLPGIVNIFIALCILNYIKHPGPFSLPIIIPMMIIGFIKFSFFVVEVLGIWKDQVLEWKMKLYRYGRNISNLFKKKRKTETENEKEQHKEEKQQDNQQNEQKQEKNEQNHYNNNNNSGNNNNAYKSEYELACEFFGVSTNTPYEEKKQIYKALVKVYHPDINKNIKAEIKMKEVNNYWDIIEKTDLNK